MLLKHLLPITGLVAATSTAALAQQATGTQGHSGTAGAMRSQQAPSTGVTSPSPGAHCSDGLSTVTMLDPGGNAIASSEYSDAKPAKSPLLKNSTHFAFTASISAF
jgi:hypothetical protein